LILEQTRLELSEYFEGTRQKFTIPLLPHGTAFQKLAWKALEKIPYGETRNYLEEATMIGNPKAVRAIGGANHNNPIVIIIPCHRVIGKNGKLVGYGWRARSKNVAPRA
jgi:O-6-methylguanine DNA methyltransferase